MSFEREKSVYMLHWRNLCDLHKLLARRRDSGYLLSDEELAAIKACDETAQAFTNVAERRSKL